VSPRVSFNSRVSCRSSVLQELPSHGPQTG
jgi:hypothetical protein